MINIENLKKIQPQYGERILTMLREDEASRGEVEKLALFFVFAMDDDLYDRRHDFYNFKAHEVKPDYFEETKGDLFYFCDSSKKLARLGLNLFNGYPADVCKTLGGLKHENLRIALTAISIRFGLLRINAKGFVYDTENLKIVKVGHDYYIEIVYDDVVGYASLSAEDKKFFRMMHIKNQIAHGMKAKREFVPVKVERCPGYLRVDFNSGGWLHYYDDGAWA